jgi:hypothetical protein
MKTKCTNAKSWTLFYTGGENDLEDIIESNDIIGIYSVGSR